jgi:hypothetical protein
MSAYFVVVCRVAPVAALGSAAANACARSAWLPKAISAKGACRCGEAGEVCGAAGPWACGSRRCIWRRADVAGRSQFAGNEFISGLSVAEVRKVETSFDEGWPERFVDVPDAPANPCAERLDVSNHPPRSHSTCSSPKIIAGVSLTRGAQVPRGNADDYGSSRDPSRISPTSLFRGWPPGEARLASRSPDQVRPGASKSKTHYIWPGDRRDRSPKLVPPIP